MQKKDNIKHISFALVLILFCINYYYGIINRLPFSVHCWAQSDRFSLAVNYFDSGMNFFLPRTYNMFPKDRVVGVEFPILAYITALLGHIFGRHNLAACNRLLGIVIVCTGLFYLYLTGLKLTKNFILSVFTPLFIFCSPVFIFYSGSFLPDPVAVAIFFIGQYYYISFIKEEKKRNFYMAMGFMLLASLVKNTIVFYFSAIMLFEFIRQIRISKGKARAVVPVVTCGILSAIAVGCWFLYTVHLNKTYGSTVFMAAPNPFKSWAEFLYFMGLGGNFHKTTIKAVLFDYMVPPQYLLFIILLLWGIYKSYQLHRWQLPFLCLLFLGAASMGVALFGGQLFVHDYYEIAIFIPFITIVCLMGVYTITTYTSVASKAGSSKRTANTMLSVAAVLGIIVCFFFSAKKTHARFSPDYAPFNYHHKEDWMRNAEAFLNKNKIYSDVPIAVLGEKSPNEPFTCFDRKGINLYEEDLGYNNHVAEKLMRERNIRFLIAKTETIDNYKKENPSYFDDFIFVEKDGDKNLFILRQP